MTDWTQKLRITKITAEITTKRSKINDKPTDSPQ